jgi:hypothetical protein
MLQVRGNAGSIPENALELCDGNAMLLVFLTVAAVPIKPLYPQKHHTLSLHKCIDKRQVE